MGVIGVVVIGLWLAMIIKQSDAWLVCVGGERFISPGWLLSHLVCDGKLTGRPPLPPPPSLHYSQVINSAIINLNKNKGEGGEWETGSVGEAINWSNKAPCPFFPLLVSFLFSIKFDQHPKKPWKENVDPNVDPKIKLKKGWQNVFKLLFYETWKKLIGKKCRQFFSPPPSYYEIAILFDLFSSHSKPKQQGDKANRRNVAHRTFKWKWKHKKEDNCKPPNQLGIFACPSKTNCLMWWNGWLYN